MSICFLHKILLSFQNHIIEFIDFECKKNTQNQHLRTIFVRGIKF